MHSLYHGIKALDHTPTIEQIPLTRYPAEALSMIYSIVRHLTERLPVTITSLDALKELP